MRGTKYPMIVMAMDQANISAKELCARCGMSVSAFQNKMRKTVQNSKERAFSLDECYLIDPPERELEAADAGVGADGAIASADARKQALLEQVNLIGAEGMKVHGTG